MAPQRMLAISGNSAPKICHGGTLEVFTVARENAPAAPRENAAGSAPPAPGRRARSAGLDGVRALAAVAVMAFHEGFSASTCSSC